jgi:hypothetical protein
MDDIDLLSASLRTDAAELGSFAEALARRFEEALPHQTRVARARRGLLSRDKFVREVALDVDGDRFCLRPDGGGVEATRARLSGGIALKTERLDVPEWIDALTQSLAREAERSAEAQQALQRMLD